MPPRRGLTMVEFLVVLAILSVMLALLVPAVQAARERARETVCKNNLHQINLAVAQFVQVHKQLPAKSTSGRTGGWIVAILPFIEQQNLLATISVDAAIADVPQSLHEPPAMFRCPRRSVLDGELGNAISPGHYVLVPTAGRESFSLFDAPVTMQVPWVSGPEMDYAAVTRSTGPHSGGFFCAQGFQQGIGFMLNGSAH